MGERNFREINEIELLSGSIPPGKMAVGIHPNQRSPIDGFAG